MNCALLLLSAWIAIAGSAAPIAYAQSMQAPTASDAVTRAPRSRYVPLNAGVIDVTQPPFRARGDGIHDDTQAINAALAAARPEGAGSKIIYLPAGTYRITDTLRFDGSRTTLRGETREATRIVLDSSALGFGDPDSPKRCVSTREASGFSANQFDVYVTDLTIDSGSGNPGAVALLFHGNNVGAVRRLRLTSGDGGGVYGLDLAGSDKGPSYISDVVIEGFDVGLRSSGTEYGFVLEDLELAGQHVYGIRNLWNALTIRRLRSTNTVPAIFNEKATANDFRWGTVVLLDSDLDGGAPGAVGIENEAALFLRGVRSTGYGALVSERGVASDFVEVNGPDEEYVEPRAYSLFDGTGRSLDLPIASTPSPSTDIPAWNWRSAVEFGALPNDGVDDAPALQAAIDRGVRVLFLPAGQYELGATVNLGGSLELLALMHSRLVPTDAFAATGEPMLAVAQGGPVVTVESGRVEASLGGAISHDVTSRALVLRDITIGGPFLASGAGETFVENCGGGPWRFTDGHRATLRQLNPENLGTKLTNDGATVVCMGLKTEKAGIVAETLNGGRTEILGGLVYPVATLPLQQPMFRTEDSELSAVIHESAYGGNGRSHNLIVDETRGGERRRLFETEVPSRVGFGFGAQLSLYSSETSVTPSPPPIPKARYEFDSTDLGLDASGNGNDGSAADVTAISGGISGGAAEFNGATSLIDLPATLLSSDAGAVSLWCRPAPQAPGERSLILYGSSLSTGNGYGAEPELHVGLTDGRAGLWIRGATGEDLWLRSADRIDDGDWHHVAASWHRGPGQAQWCDLYVDGRLEDQGRVDLVSFDAATGLVRIGGPGTAARRYEGSLDRLVMFDRPLRQFEVIDDWRDSRGFLNYPPSADAGLDFVVQNSAWSAPLLGQVEDDSQPFGSLLTSWTATAPGVTFAPPSEAASVATFSAAGVYDLSLAADDGDETTVDTVQARVFEPLPAPWENADAGDVGAPGFVTGSINASFEVRGGGTRIGGNSITKGDSFHFAYQAIDASSGREVRVRIDSLEGMDPDGRAGVMYRLNLDRARANVFIGLSPTLGLLQTHRAGSGGNTTVLSVDSSPTLPVWVRVRRLGTNSFQTGWSPDGTTWTDLDPVTVNTGSPGGLMGLARCSGDLTEAGAGFAGAYVGP